MKLILVLVCMNSDIVCSLQTAVFSTRIYDFVEDCYADEARFMARASPRGRPYQVVCSVISDWALPPVEEP
jgi:hypothetical protein